MGLKRICLNYDRRHAQDMGENAMTRDALLTSGDVYTPPDFCEEKNLSDRDLQRSASRPLQVIVAEVPGPPKHLYISIGEEGAADPILVVHEEAIRGIPRWMPRIAERAATLLSLPDGWDSYGADRVEPGAIRSALSLLQLVSTADTTAPALVPLSDGRVQVEWHRQGQDLEIEVGENGWLRVYDAGREGGGRV